MKFEEKKFTKRERERSKTETEKDVESFLISYHTHYTTTAAELYCHHWWKYSWWKQNTEAEN